MPRSIPRPLPAAVALAAVAALLITVLIATGHGGIAGEASLRAAWQFFTFVH